MDPNIQTPSIIPPPTAAPAQNSSVQSPLSQPPNSKNKKWLFAVAALFILTIMIFIPIPEYRGIALCKMGIPCPAAGWYLGPSPFTRIAMRIQSQNLEQGTTTPIVTQAPSPTPDLNREPTGSAATANWKTYNSSFYRFKYPPNLVIKETDKDLLVLYQEGDSPSNTEILIDARLTGRNADYINTVEMAKKDIVNAKVENTKNGVKIYGTLGPGYGEGAPVIATYFKYNQGAILVEANTIDENKLAIYNQILSTFKFTNQTTYACPKTKNIDCMPIVDESRKDECAPAYLRWIQTYCPGVTVTQ